METFMGADALRAYGPEVSADAQVDAWERYHAARIAVWDEIGALVERGDLAVTSALEDRRWAAMYRNAGLSHWLDQLTPGGRRVAEQCLGVLAFVRVRLPDGAMVGAAGIITGALVRRENVPATVDPHTGEQVAGYTREVQIPLGLQSYGRMVCARDRYFRSVARLAHEWVWQRASLHGDAIMDSHQDAITETLAAVETYWPALGKFSTWLYSRLLGVYTNRLRQNKRAPVPTHALSVPDIVNEDITNSPGPGEVSHHTLVTQAMGAGAENPWPAAEVDLDAGRVVVRATGELEGQPVVLDVCKAHRAALVKGAWRRRVLPAQPLSCACGLCHTARTPVDKLAAAGMLDGVRV